MILPHLSTTLEKIRQTKPLILCLTNYVTMDFMANSLLALGAAPLMSSAVQEFAELIQLSHALMINIGTLDDTFIANCHTAITLAKRYQKPIILDPVGAGASNFRTQHARQLMTSANIIRGNTSEINALFQDNTHTLGVEAIHTLAHVKTTAQKLAQHLTCTIIVSGAQDFITNSQQNCILNVGSPIMPLITGMGCTLTAVIAAFHAVEPDAYAASLLATAYFGLCGNLAQIKTSHPGTFRQYFVDELHAANLTAMQPFIEKAI